MEKHGNALRYELAAAILPSRLRRIAMEQPEEVKEHAGGVPFAGGALYVGAAARR